MESPFEIKSLMDNPHFRYETKMFNKPLFPIPYNSEKSIVMEWRILDGIYMLSIT